MAALDVFLVVRRELFGVAVVIANREPQDHVVNSAKPLCVTMPRSSFPYDLVAEILVSENRIHEHFDVVAGYWIAMQENVSSRFEQPLH